MKPTPQPEWKIPLRNTENKNMNKTRFTLLAGMILAATASRLVPHPPDFSPIAAIALFGGATFANKRAAFLVPLAALFLSDLVLGFYAITPVVYGAFAIIACLGLWLRRRRTVGRIAGAAIAGAFLFFALTNLGVWAISGWYPKTPAGLIECYAAAIPFFRNTLLSNLLYATLLFGGLALTENRFARVREGAAATV
jgi:hypothetical protein